MVAIYFDVTRLYIRESLTSPTGIDRVTEAYARWLLARPDVELFPVCAWGGLIWPMKRGYVETILERKSEDPPGAEAQWTALMTALRQLGSESGVLRAGRAPDLWDKVRRRYAPAALRTLAHWRPARPIADGLYMNVSHYGLEQDGLLARAQRLGLRPVILIHDLIPIEHPEFCSPSAQGWHIKRMDAVLDHAHLVIANSQATSKAIKAYAHAKGREPPPICTAPLGLEPAFLDAAYKPLGCAPYFVSVGTLEPRKNLAFLLTLWSRLASKLGEATPRLVLVGQRGWENEAIIDHLERSPSIKRHVHEASGLADRHVVQLISGAQALLAPSIVEGYDLPVSEALALGAPVIASDIPVHRDWPRAAS